MTIAGPPPQIHLPRVEIQFCVKCKWNLRAAYYAQELLQTFCSPPSEITLGEISLVPVTGGIFTVTLYHLPSTPSTSPSTSTSTATQTTSTLLSQNNPALSELTATQVWDRKADGGFPETKELKNRIRNLIDPSRDMGHIDRSLRKGKSEGEGGAQGGHEAPREAGNVSGTPVEPASTQMSQRHRHQHEAGSSTEGDRSDAATEANDIGDCEECRLAARESLEDQLGRITASSTVI